MELQVLQQKILTDRNFRKNLAINNFYWFTHIYFSHYLDFPTADFQKQIYAALENWDEKFVEIIAFRNSAKSTISTLALPIWSVISGKSNFVLLLTDTFGQAKLALYNIKSELEANPLLIQDFGGFEGVEEWTATDLVLSKYNARISSRSTGQKIRGLRHRQFRPNLCVGDDLESIESVRTKDQRDKTYEWFLGDVMPSLSRDGKIVLIGNLLHSDSLMMRVKRELEEGKRKGVKLEFPLVNDNGEIAWQAKFPNTEAIEEEKRKISDNRTWLREYLLRVIPSEGQVVKDEWIKYYTTIPEGILNQGTGIDLAISKRSTADFTAMVSGKLIQQGDEKRIYIMPNPVNERLTMFEATERAKNVSLALGSGTLTDLWVEDTAYQRSAIEAMEREGLPAKAFKVSGDKRSRLETIATYVQNGTVLFPKRGCEDLIMQLTNFGSERWDDLCDGFSILVSSLMSQSFNKPQLFILGSDDEEEPDEHEGLKPPTKFGHSRQWYLDRGEYPPSLKIR